MGWFCNENSKLTRSTAQSAPKIDSKFLEVKKPEKPKNLPPWQYYSSRHYHERVKAAFNEEWARISKKVIAEREKPDTEISVRSDVTQHMYEQESEEFKEQLKLEAKEDYNRRLAEYNKQLGIDESLPNAERRQRWDL